MGDEKWKRVPILAYLYNKIDEKYVKPGKYTSVSSFVEDAVREKLAREEGKNIDLGLEVIG